MVPSLPPKDVASQQANQANKPGPMTVDGQAEPDNSYTSFMTW
jgi:hypothetical protein